MIWTKVSPAAPELADNSVSAAAAALACRAGTFATLAASWGGVMSRGLVSAVLASYTVSLTATRPAIHELDILIY